MEIRGPMQPGYETVLTPAALEFVADLTRRFGDRVTELLAARATLQKRLDDGVLPDFLPETADVRKAQWRVTRIPDDLQDRRVEITGPTDRKMVINALNSGAKVFMADCEDSLTPTWDNVVQGQINLRDAVTPRQSRSRIPTASSTASIRRSRRCSCGRAAGTSTRSTCRSTASRCPARSSTSACTCSTTTRRCKARGTGPYFYLPKLENHLEARLWADVFKHSEATLGIAPQTIKVTVLIETILAAFEMDEILHELKDYIVGLNCGRWDYIFSFIKKFSRRPDFVLPDRQQVTMTTHFLRSYSKLLIKTCHRRGAFAMGGMAPQIPIKNDPKANEEALAKVRADKEREAGDGHDGTWVAHPGPRADRDGNLRPADADAEPAAQDAARTSRSAAQRPAADSARARSPRRACAATSASRMQYIAAWLGGLGCVPINNLMEDAATAEISRAQIWQWIKHPAGKLDDGRKVTVELFRKVVREELDKLAGCLRRASLRGRQLRTRRHADRPRSRPRRSSGRSSRCRPTRKSTERENLT